MILASWRVLSAAWYDFSTLAKYARWMVAHGESCLMPWWKRNTVIWRHGFTALRSPDNLLKQRNGDMVTLRQRNIWRQVLRLHSQLVICWHGVTMTRRQRHCDLETWFYADTHIWWCYIHYLKTLIILLSFYTHLLYTDTLFLYFNRITLFVYIFKYYLTLKLSVFYFHFVF